MLSERRSRRISIFLSLAFLFPVVIGPPSTSGFTQFGFNAGFGAGIPMGHEWLTRLAAIELLGYSPPSVPDIRDPNDPRRGWTQGLARNLDLSSPGAQAEVRRIKAQAWNDTLVYASRYKAVYDVIVGQRWVDLAGYNAITSKECWDSVAQEAVEVQYDHFMRRWDDRDAEGGIGTAKSSRARFVDYFVAAAMAPPTIMSVYDGGPVGSTAVEVDRNYFLLGRATHMFQDSFSSEHTVRIPEDNYVRVRQVKSYMCAPGSEQHTHSKTDVITYKSGDVVWKQGTALAAGWGGYKASNMKAVALVATEATKDLWAAFIRTMGTNMSDRERVARAEAQTLADHWLSSDDNEMRVWYDDRSHRDSTFVRSTTEDPDGVDVKRCMVALKVGTDVPAVRAAQLQVSQRKCLYNALPWPGYSDLYDTSLRIWYAWLWRNKVKLEVPPDGWVIPTLPADSGTRVRIKSADNGAYMSAPDGVSPGAWVYCRANTTPLDFILVGSKADGAYRVANAPALFLSYTTATGAVMLYKPTILETPTNYLVAPAGAGTWSILNIYWQRYMWLNGRTLSPYITSTGNPGNRNSQWFIEGLN